ncbi:MAG: DNA-binding XRE family transcriptional regulator [bacterium]|jgi:DNA-binding XRE family transcriptional regulator
MLLNYLNKILLNRLGLNIYVEGAEIGVKKIRFKKLIIQKNKKDIVEIEQVKVNPTWKLAFQLAGNFEAESLTWGDFHIEKCNGAFFFDTKTGILNGIGEWQKHPVNIGLKTDWNREVEDQAFTAITVNLDSKEESKIEEEGKLLESEHLFDLNGPFEANIDVLINRKKSKENSFNQLIWNAEIKAKSLIYDMISFPDFHLKTRKFQGKDAVLEFIQSSREGITGSVALSYQKEYKLKGRLKFEQPLLSRYLKKYQDISDIDESLKIWFNIVSRADTFQSLWKDLILKGNFSIKPKKLNLIQYSHFQGKIQISPHHIEIAVPDFHINEGTGSLTFHNNFEKEWEFRVDLNNSEVTPFFKVFKNKHIISGLGTGSWIYGQQEKSKHHYMNCNLKIRNGDISNYSDLIDSFLPWKEVQEVRKQLLNIEGFKHLILNFEYREGDYLLDKVELQGHMTPNLRLSGKIKKEKKLDLLLEATVAIATVIFSIKGPFKTPLILPAPGKMAGRIVEKSSRAAFSLIESLKDLTK